MSMAKNYGPLAVASSTRCRVLSVGCSTERNFPGLHALFSGRESSPPGDALVAGLLLILLFAGALLIPFERLIPQERDGKQVLTLYQHRLTPEEKLWWYGKGAV